MAQLSPQTFLVVDDHDSVLEGTCQILQSQYPETKIVKANVADKVEPTVKDAEPDLVIMDLSIPSAWGEPAQTEVGLQLLRTLLQGYSHLNFVVQSAHVQSIALLKPCIDKHLGGFTIAAKSLPRDEMLTKVDWALKGLIYTPPELRMGLEVKPEWIQMLKLAFEQGLTDKAIAEEMYVSPRSIRHYWTRVQDALGVYPDERGNIRIQTYNKARKVGLID